MMPRSSGSLVSAVQAHAPAAARAGILAITSQLPWPLDRGGHLRSFHMLRSLAQRFDVRLVSGGPGDHHTQEAVVTLERVGIETHAVVLPRRTMWTEASRVASCVSRGEPYVLYGRHRWEAVREAIRGEVERRKPALLYLDHLDSYLFHDLAPQTPRLVDMHNVYSLLVERMAAEARSPVKRTWFMRDAKALDRIEREVAAEAECLFSVSDEEADHFRRLGARNVHVIPNGVDCATYSGLGQADGHRASAPVILYSGTLSWTPNAEAARFLAEQAMPVVRASRPDVTLRIVGRDPTPEVRALANLPGVEVLANVPDMKPHLAEAHLLAVPLESGGGTRLKILEAFAAGLPVVSTPVGCEGLRVSQDREILIADRLAFPQALLALIAEPARAARLAAAARHLAETEYDWSVIGADACDAIDALLISRPYSADA
jgi:polysaccharide biosynthesis protein PslH